MIQPTKIDGGLRGEGFRFGVVVSRFNSFITERLLQGAVDALERGVEMPQEEGLFLEATLFGLCCATEDMREGTKAFLEKRPAQFRGK